MRYKVEYRNKKTGIYPRVRLSSGGALEIYDVDAEYRERLRSICPPDGYRSVFVIYDDEHEGWSVARRKDLT